MHNHVANRGRKALLNQIFSVFLIFTLYFNAFSSAHAAGFGAWTITNTVVQGASTILTGSKEVILNGAKKIATGTAKITPNASQVAKVLRGGAAGYALSIAVEQLLGSVDWVLDPANNRIKYNEQPNNPVNSQYMYRIGNVIYSYSGYLDAAEQWFKKDMLPKYPLDYKSFSYVEQNPRANCHYATGSYYSCNVLVHYINGSNEPAKTNILVNQLANPAYDPNAETEEKYLPLPVVAQKVISNAESGDTNAQVATTAAAADIINEAENDNVKARPIVQQLENTQSIPTDQTAQGDAVPKENANTENPSSSVAAPEMDLSLDFPIFCDWAPSICQAAKWVITQPQVWADAVTDSWDWTKTKYEAAVTSITDFFKNEPNSDSDNSLPVQEIPLPQLNTGTFKATAGCPAPIPINITIGTKGTGQISYEPICQFASKWSFVAPLIGFLSGAMILVGVGRKGEDSEI